MSEPAQDPADCSPPKRDPSIARELIKHENDLIDHRLTWFITIQGLLFTALGFAWGKSDAKSLVFVFSGLGFLTAISTAFVLWGGAFAIENLSRTKDTVEEPMIGRRAGVEKIAYPWFSFPVLFGMAWILIAWINSQTQPNTVTVAPTQELSTPHVSKKITESTPE